MIGAEGDGRVTVRCENVDDRGETKRRGVEHNHRLAFDAVDHIVYICSVSSDVEVGDDGMGGADLPAGFNRGFCAETVELHRGCDVRRVGEAE